jgi:hypothetical protein
LGDKNPETGELIVRSCLLSVSEWLEAYLQTEESGTRGGRGGGEGRRGGGGSDDEDDDDDDDDDEDGANNPILNSFSSGVEPELHKAMFLLLSRAYTYSLETEDILELAGFNRALALQTVVGVLEDGETYATELVQRAKPGFGQVGQ